MGYSLSGTGKTMLASRLPGILPPLEEAEALQAAAVCSVAGQGIDFHRWKMRPFRAPHHTASAAALVGGGSIPRPGEISLAHHGVLFLDESQLSILAVMALQMAFECFLQLTGRGFSSKDATTIAFRRTAELFVGALNSTKFINASGGRAYAIANCWARLLESTAFGSGSASRRFELSVSRLHGATVDWVNEFESLVLDSEKVWL